MFTPGPYSLDDDIAVAHRVISDSTGRTIAIVFGRHLVLDDGQPSDDERDATARLLASAPEMYALLDDIAKPAGTIEDWIHSARDLIIFIEGEGA